jgi:hypothetical protein
MQYEKLDLITLKLLFDDYKKMEQLKRDELKIIKAELELIEAFIDHASRCIYRIEQLKTNNNEVQN